MGIAVNKCGGILLAVIFNSSSYPVISQDSSDSTVPMKQMTVF
jgi:hypothetical protein